MNKDKIQIDGVWYIREDQSEKKLDVTNFIGCVYENDECVWEATKIYQDDDKTFYPDVSIKFTDKRVKPWKEEYWDNEAWILGILEDKSIDEVKESMSDKGIKEFKQFVKMLIEKDWFNTYTND
jgi:hypothetical protein